MQALVLPWAAGNGAEERRTFLFPPQWQTELLEIAGWEAGEGPDLEQVSEYVQELAAGGRSISIAIEDHTRPTPLEGVLTAVLDGVAAAGIPNDRVDIVIAVGAHAQLSQEEVRRKVGVRIAETYSVRSHDINGPLADSGQRVGNLPLLLDGRFLQADRRLTVGSVIPNPYAGFSGGGKMVLPGLAGVDVLVWLHRLAQMGGSSGPGVPGNRIRMEIDRVTSALPLHGSVLCLVDSGRQVREIFCGPPVPTHRHAAAVAASRYRTPLSGIYDVFICNAYPKDAEFIQSATGYTPVRTGGQRHLAEGGTVVLLSAAYRGIGEHALFGSGGPLHRSRNTPHPELGGADVAVFTTGVSASEVAVTHWPGYPVYSRWEDVVSHLLARFGSHARVGIFPAAALQLGPGS